MNAETLVVDTKHRTQGGHCNFRHLAKQQKYDHHCIKRLTCGISVEKERVLELEVQVFSNGFCSVFHAEPIHNGESVLWRGRPGNYGAGERHIAKHSIPAV